MKFRPKMLGSLSEPTYMEFVILAVLAVLSVTAIVIFLPKKANTPPTAEACNLEIQENTPKSITIAGNDENGDQLTYSVIVDPEHGQLSGTAPNLTYNPETNFHGSDSFSFKVNDGKTDSDVAVVSIEVESVTANVTLETYNLTITAGDGSVTKNPDKAGYNLDETVTLQAVPKMGYNFTKWLGDLSGTTNPTTLVMDADKSVSASFSLKAYSLTVTGGNGSVTKSPDKARYNHGEAVTLEAVPNAWYSFANWSGDLSGDTNPATLVMDTDKTVSADFAPKTYSLTSSAIGGSVIKNPEKAGYNHGEKVTLEAVPNEGYSFTSWSGDLSGDTNPIMLVMDANKSVSAGFALKGYGLTVKYIGGSVTKSPDKVIYNRGETVTLKAAPNEGYSFTNWAGDLSGGINPVTLVMDADKSVAAVFALEADNAGTRFIGINMIYVPAGSFMMGSSDSAAQLAGEYDKKEKDFANEFPQHPVRISKSFWMSRTEITQGQYRSVMNARPWYGKAYVQEDANNPAVYVSWDDAMEFCRRLSQKEGRTYRLPTEAEWEYACRAGTTTRFSFGSSDSSLGDYVWFDGNADKIGQDYAHPVGQKNPNPWGFYDMHGNVFEWCSDYYDEKYYSNSPSIDPKGSPSGISHSVRGGSWDSSEDYLRSSYRSDYPVSSGLLVGFRVVDDGTPYGEVVTVPTEVELVKEQPKAKEDSMKVQEALPVDVKPKEAASITVKPQETLPIAVKPQEETATSNVSAKDIAITGTDSTLTYTSDNVYDILDQAAVDARNGKVGQAQAALTSLLKDKDAGILAGYELGLIHYENGELDKAIPFFKDVLSAAFGEPATDKDEQMLIAMLNEVADAARIRYELGLICQSQGKKDQAAKLFRDSLSIISAQGATYVGVKKCKSCHFKQWNSWRKTNMAKAFDSLKPGIKSEEKTKLKFDPNKDYTMDASCLGCHTSGFGIPGGYVVPADGDAEAKKQAEDNAGVTCEGCHGPGSKSIEIQKDINENKRTYTFEELRAVGFHKAGVQSCTPCHNAADPGKEPGYHFEYEEKRKEDQHENFELKYRQD